MTSEAASCHRPPAAPSYDVVWPGAPLGIERRELAPRLDTLDGKRIGFLWDYVFRGDELFPVLERELAARYRRRELRGLRRLRQHARP